MVIHRIKGQHNGDEHHSHTQLSICPQLYLYTYIVMQYFINKLKCTKILYHDDMFVGQLFHKQTKKSSLGHNR